ncbi:MAG: ABC transporter ATP-binding protein [Phycisphaerales bacterium]
MTRVARETAAPRWALFRLIRPYGRDLVVVTGMLFLLALADLAAPWFLKVLIDDVFPSAEAVASLEGGRVAGAGLGQDVPSDVSVEDKPEAGSEAKPEATPGANAKPKPKPNAKPNAQPNPATAPAPGPPLSDGRDPAAWAPTRQSIASTDADGPSGGGRWDLLWLVLPGMALSYVARNALFYGSRMRATRVSEDVGVRLRRRLFEHLQRLGLRYYRSNQPGRVSARLMDDTYKVQGFVQDKLPTLVRYAIELVVLLVVIFTVNWRLALAATLVLPLHFWTWRRFRGPIRRSHSEAQEHIADAHAGIVESFLGIEVVKGFGAEERESENFSQAIDASRKSTIRTQRYHFTQKVVADLLVGLGTVLLVGYGAWEVFQGRMTGGGFLMFFWYVKMLYPAVLEVISGTGHLARATSSVERVHELLDEPVVDRAGRGDGVAELGELRGRIEYRDLNFRYEADGPMVLTGVRMTIEPGEHVAITGHSGAGKSTLISMLPRFNEPTSGQVLIDGRPADTIEVGALRGLFGFVFQDLFLFNASIRDNLRYARPDASDDEIIEACRATGADAFIRRLPDGYETVIGDPGGELSRGEKQRLTIARAVVRDPRVLVIDEATASIDPEAAHEIIRALLQRMVGRTVIMVTHDPTMIDLVDRVITIESGRVARDEATVRARRALGLLEPDASQLIGAPLAADMLPLVPRATPGPPGLGSTGAGLGSAPGAGANGAASSSVRAGASASANASPEAEAETGAIDDSDAAASAAERGGAAGGGRMDSAAEEPAAGGEPRGQ